MYKTYNNMTEKDIQDIIDSLRVKPEGKRMVAYCVDERDGVWKNFEDTKQFNDKLKELVNKNEQG